MTTVSAAPAPSATVPGRRRAWGPWAVLLALLGTEIAVLLTQGPGDARRWYLMLLPVGVVAMLAGWRLTRDLPARHVAWLVVGGGLLLRAVLVTTPPALSTDVYRYLWDGRVQATGTNPYVLPPDSDALAGLRDETVWPEINRKDERTIYPGGAQLTFRAAHGVGLRSTTTWKAFMVASDVAAIGLLVWLLRRRDLSPRHAVLYAWNPLAVLAVAQVGHLDALAMPLLVLAIAAWDEDRPAVTGVLVGAAGALKLYPLLVLPALLRRRDGRWARATTPVAIAVVAVSYVPYAAAGRLMGGYLTSGYLREEGYESGYRFALARLVGLDELWIVAGVGLVVAGWAARSRIDAARKAAVVWASALLLTTPYGWYALALVGLAVVARPERPAVGRLVWPTFAAGLYAVYLLLHLGLRPVAPTTMRLVLVAATVTALAVGVAWTNRHRRPAWA